MAYSWQRKPKTTFTKQNEILCTSLVTRRCPGNAFFLIDNPLVDGLRLPVSLSFLLIYLVILSSGCPHALIFRSGPGPLGITALWRHAVHRVLNESAKMDTTKY